MKNQKRLEEYLVGDKEKKVVGYLKDILSNGKVIMLSGKWGSGKTFFWKEIIEKNLKSEEIPNNYISLYGKTSIEQIKNEVFLKIFESMDIFKIDEKSVKLVKNTANLVADIIKTVSVFGLNLDLPKIVDKSFEKLEQVREGQKEEKTKALLNSGAIICFDDFERKSKDIDLNDLFGFITNLTIEFDCKVVIILNDDVFEGEEKKIFSNVKEKSVSKFLKYEPKIDELFNLIFDLEIEKDGKKEKKYKDLDSYKEIILKTIEETGELNARIYIQVLDNLVEWIESNQEKDTDILRCLILVNINFILYHNILTIRRKIETKDNEFYAYSLDKKFDEFFKFFYEEDEYYMNYEGYELQLMNKISSDEYLLSCFKNNKNLFKSHYFANRFLISEFVDDDIFQKINNFIETGIII